MSERLKELSPEARALIDAARAVEDPSTDDKRRVAAALASQLAIPMPFDPTAAATTGAETGAATGATSAASSGATAGGTGAAAGAKAAAIGTTAAATKITAATAAKVKIALVIAAASAGGVATYSAMRPADPQQQRPVAAVQPVRQPASERPAPRLRRDIRAAAPAEQAAPAERTSPPSPSEAAAAPPKKKKRPVRRSRVPAPSTPTPEAVADDEHLPAPPGDDDEPGAALAPVAAPRAPEASSPQPPPAATPASPPVCNAGREIALLRDVQTALRDKQGRRALSVLDRYARNCAPAGTFNEEARAARVLALCLIGRRSEALEQAARLLRQAPRSPQLARLRGSCAADALGPREKKNPTR